MPASTAAVPRRPRPRITRPRNRHHLPNPVEPATVAANLAPRLGTPHRCPQARQGLRGFSTCTTATAVLLCGFWPHKGIFPQCPIMDSFMLSTRLPFHKIVPSGFHTRVFAMSHMQPQTPHSKRFSSRVVTPGDVYVYWSSAGYNDTSQVRNLSSRGLFVLTQESKAVGAKANLHFLVEEGQIRAEAVVRHVKPGRGLGLQFTSVREEDRRHLADLMKRLRGFGLISRFRSGEDNQQAPLQ